MIIIFFLPSIFSKYKIEKVKQGNTQFQGEIINYSDLDADGNSDKIISFLSRQGFHCLQLYDHEGGLIDQWNLEGVLPGEKDRLITGDFDNDGLKDVFAFSQSNDSIFLYGFRPREKEPFFINHRFISALNSNRGTPEYAMFEMNLQDMNKDGYSDLIFVIQSGFSLQPRQIFIYDIYNDDLITSSPSGSIIGRLKFVDLDGDGYKEIIGNCGAAGNITESMGIPHSDYNAWLMVFDHQLNYLFEPLQYPGMHSFINTQPIIYKDSFRILSLFNHTGSLDNMRKLTIFDHKGQIIDHKEFGKTPKFQAYLYKDLKNQAWIIDDHGMIDKVNKSLQVTRTIDLENEIFINPIVLDLEEDNDPEIIIIKKGSSEGIVFQHGFKDPIIMELPIQSINNNIRSYSVINSKNNDARLFIQTGNNFTEYIYGFNLLYLLRIPLYLGIYLAILAFIQLIRKIQRIQIQEKLILQNQISELQLKTINTQLDPHFMLNAFNAIASLLIKEKGEVAYNYFMKFSKLIKTNLVSAEEISRTIEEEISTVNNYLDIQQLRHKEKFTHTVNINDNVDTEWRIPKMTIQNYVENAVKHGFKHKESGGILNIDLQSQNNHVIIIVEDNGIGRIKAAEIKSDSTGLGLELMNHYFDLLNKYNDVKIKQDIVDLYDKEGNPRGTKIQVEIPININYDIRNYV